MKYTLSMLVDIENHVIKDKVVLRSGASEVVWHIALKMLGYLLYIQDQPVIERGIGRHYKPDLVRLASDGSIDLWIDCGNIAIKKVDRVAMWMGNAGRFVILRRNAYETASLLAAGAKKLKRPERVLVRYFEDGFVDSFAAALDVGNTIECRIHDHELKLTLENRRGFSVWSSTLFYDRFS